MIGQGQQTEDSQECGREYIATGLFQIVPVHILDAFAQGNGGKEQHMNAEDGYPEDRFIVHQQHKGHAQGDAAKADAGSHEGRPDKNKDHQADLQIAKVQVHAGLLAGPVQYRLIYCFKNLFCLSGNAGRRKTHFYQGTVSLGYQEFADFNAESYRILSG